MQEGPGQEAILSMLGPIATSVEDCVLVMQTWLCDEMFSADPTFTAPLPWDDATFRSDRPLRVAVMERHAGLVSATSVRAVREAAAALEAGGAEIVKWDFGVKDQLFKDMVTCWTAALLCADQVQWLTDALDGEEPLPPGVIGVKEATAALKDNPAAVAHGLDPHSPAFVFQCQAWQRSLRDELTSRFDSLGIDLLLTPASQTAAGKSKRNDAGVFTQWVNVVGWPAGTVPVT